MENNDNKNDWINNKFDKKEVFEKKYDDFPINDYVFINEKNFNFEKDKKYKDIIFELTTDKRNVFNQFSSHILEPDINDIIRENFSLKIFNNFLEDKSEKTGEYLVLEIFGFNTTQIENAPVNDQQKEKTQDLLKMLTSINSTINDWNTPPFWPSSYVIKELHKLVTESASLSGEYQKKGLIPQNPGEYRNTDITVDGEPKNFYVSGSDVQPVMDKYTTELSERLEKIPNQSLGDVVDCAAWAYYTFIRIHPFLDGNGRTGRCILQRVLIGGGLREIDFYENFYGGDRSLHLDVMNYVDKSHDLTALKAYILFKLARQYSNKNIEDVPIINEIEALQRKIILEKNNDSKNLKDKKQDLASIWEGFNGLNIYGIRTEDIE